MIFDADWYTPAIAQLLREITRDVIGGRTCGAGHNTQRFFGIDLGIGKRARDVRNKERKQYKCFRSTCHGEAPFAQRTVASPRRRNGLRNYASIVPARTL